MVETRESARSVNIIFYLLVLYCLILASGFVLVWSLYWSSVFDFPTVKLCHFVIVTVRWFYYSLGKRLYLFWPQRLILGLFYNLMGLSAYGLGRFYVLMEILFWCVFDVPVLYLGLLYDTFYCLFCGVLAFITN